MSKKNWIFVKRGLSQDPKHREAMGNRVWLFMHIIDRADWETGVVLDWRDKVEADDMGLGWRTLQRQRQELDDLGYITCVKKKDCQNIIIRNWTNPRSYSAEVLNEKSTQKSVHQDAESTPQSTPQSTHKPNRKMRTPTSSPQDTSHNSSVRAKRAKSDPRSSHPAICAIREITGRYPSKTTYDILINAIGDAPRIEDLKTCFETWVIKGWRPDNYSWATEWYVSGIPAKFGKNGAGSQPAEPRGFQAVRDYLKNNGLSEEGVFHNGGTS